MRHTHAVDSAKASDFALQDLDWIEVDALTVLRWDGVSPLTASVVSALMSLKIAQSCGVCIAYIERYRRLHKEAA